MSTVLWCSTRSATSWPISGVRRMAMDRGDGAWLALHDLQVHQDFARMLLGAAELVAVQIDEAHVLGFHEAFRAERGRAERDVLADADGDVAAVAIHVSAMPEAAADLANLFLERVRLR